MSDKKQTGHGVFGKGYYIALILCAAAIGITGFWYYRNANEEDTQIQQLAQDPTVSVTLPREDVAVISTQPQATTPEGTTVPDKQVPKQSLKTTAPVAGDAVYDYSMEVLSYNQTTRDWRTHDGLDIPADAGTQVVAAADGEVYTIYEDDSMGTTVVIRHTGGYITRYASLSKNLAVTVGQTVTMGQAIGTVGQTAVVETTLGPHVHFSVSYQDTPMDPAEFLAMT